jgi:secondary thiamine-phosphate synthase enzyme
MIITDSVTLSTQGFGDLRDITPEVNDSVRESGLKGGTVTVFVAGATAGVTTIEYEPGLVHDFSAMWERIVPRDMPYQHDNRWGDGNGFSHTRAALLGPSLVVPFGGGGLLLGTWQQIVVADFDNRPRQRTIILQLMGE